MDHVHQELDEGGFSGSVVADKGENGSLWDLEGRRVQGLGAAIALAEGVGLDGRHHRLCGRLPIGG